jgi:hypothetical protein
MELDDLKTAWQRERAAYPWDDDPKTILAETKKLAMKRDRDFRLQQWIQILCSLFGLGNMVTLCRRDNPLVANAGLIVMLLGMALMLAGIIILRYRLRESHPWLPDEEFLNEERKKIEARIALLRRNVIWLLIPSITGFLMWQIALSSSVQWTVAIIIHAAIALIGMFLFYRWKLRRDLLPILEGIDRDLEQVRSHADSLPD